MDVQFKDTEKKFSADNTRTCDICKKSKASYTCPRCNIQYCGLECYRDPAKHLKCSEDFFQNEVITELKMCKLEDKDDRTKMLEILKKESKLHEKETILPGDQLSEDSESETESEQNLDDDKLIRAYQDEVSKWSPWWIKHKEAMVKELNGQSQEFKFNSSLIRKSANINVANANPMLFNDVICLFYTYSIFAYIYQLEEDSTCTEVDVNNNFTEEIIVNFLKVDKLLNAQALNGKSVNLSKRIEVTIKVLIDEKTIFLKDYLNEKFLADLINEVIFMNESPDTLLKFISVLYDLFDKYSKTKAKQTKAIDSIGMVTEEVEEDEDETPINVFHYNKEKIMKSKQAQSNKKSKIKIISPLKPKETKKTISPKVDKPSAADISRVIKVFMKRLEFYYRWLEFKLVDIKSINRMSQTSEELRLLLSNLNSELEQFNGEKELIDKYIDRIRKDTSMKSDKVLIEEI